MKRRLLILSLFWVTLPALARGGESERFPWLSSLDEARVLASSEDKPLLIVFRCEP